MFTGQILEVSLPCCSNQDMKGENGDNRSHRNFNKNLPNYMLSKLEELSLK